mgnify:CR=1 FL=1
MKRIYLFFILTFIAVGCSQKIIYQKDPKLLQAIKLGVAEYYSVKSAGDKNKLFVRMYETPNSVVFIISNFTKYPKNLKRIIKNSNRYLQLDDTRVPVIFDLDRYAGNDKTDIPVIGIRGYMVELDFRGNLIKKGFIL